MTLISAPPLRRWASKNCCKMVVLTAGWAKAGVSSPAANCADWPLPARCSHDAPLMLLDEPTEGLDAATESQILASVGRCHARKKPC